MTSGRDFDGSVLRMVDLPFMACRVDFDGTIREASEPLRGFLGIDPEGRPWQEFLHPDDRAIAAAPAPGVEVRMRDHGGAYHWLAWDAQPDRSGQGAVAVAVAIADRHAAEVESRESELGLVEAERLATLGTMAAGIVHEVNNPLTYVRLIMNRLVSLERSRVSDDPLAGHRLELLQDIREGVDQITEIVKALQAFSYAGQGRTGPVDLVRTLQAAARIAAHELRHRARLVFDVGEVPRVWGDEARLTQLFLSLLIHAAQAIPEGEAHLNEIRIAASRSGPGRVAIEVRDTGIGIPPELLERVFDPQDTTLPPGRGTGLGLAICRRIVAEHGGDISVESAPGKGTVVRVTLPRAAAEAVEMEKGDDAAAGGVPPVLPRRHATAPPIVHVGRARILVIDDDRAVAAAIAAELSDLHDVRVAESGREAFEILNRDDAFDVILCDLMMPEVSGMDVFDALRLTRPRLAERFVAMTGGAFTPRARRFVDRHEVPVVTKPITAVELHEVVQRVLASVAGPPIRSRRHGASSRSARDET